MNALVPRAALRVQANGRRRLVRAAVNALLALVCALALIVGGRALAAAYANHRGDQALTQQDFAGAEGWYRQNLTWNWFEPWVAPYNTGVALYYENNWAAAQQQFSRALPLAPKDKKCQVALNLSWAYEAEGDSLNQRGQPDAAAQRWAQAKQAATSAHCEDAGSAGQSSMVPKRPEQAPDRSQGSPQQQQQQTNDRVEKKIDDEKSSSTPPPASSQETDADPKDKLNKDNNEAQSGQGKRQDQQSGKGDSQGKGDPTW